MTPLMIFIPALIVVALIGSRQQLTCEIQPRPFRSVVDRPIPILLTFLALVTLPMAAIAAATDGSGFRGWATEFLSLVQRFALLGLIVSVPLVIRAYRLWRADGVEVTRQGLDVDDVR